MNHPESLPRGTIQAVVFDLDDTLYPERSFAFSGFAAVAAAFHGRLGDRAKSAARMAALFDSEHRSRVFDVLLRENGLDSAAALREDMIETYRIHRPAIILYRDADGWLTKWSRAFRIGIITDGRSDTQWNKIDALGLRGRVNEIIVTSDLGEGLEKPHPQAFEVMAMKLGVVHHRCAYVGDNATKDFLAPNALGWRTIHLRREDGLYANSTPPPGGAPDRVIHSLDESESILQPDARPFS